MFYDIFVESLTGGRLDDCQAAVLEAFEAEQPATVASWRRELSVTLGINAATSSPVATAAPVAVTHSAPDVMR